MHQTKASIISLNSLVAIDGKEFVAINMIVFCVSF
jgi:hypothetical protein